MKQTINHHLRKSAHKCHTLILTVDICQPFPFFRSHYPHLPQRNCSYSSICEDSGAANQYALPAPRLQVGHVIRSIQSEKLISLTPIVSEMDT